MNFIKKITAFIDIAVECFKKSSRWVEGDMVLSRAVDCQASEDPIHQLGLTIHSSNHEPFNLY